MNDHNSKKKNDKIEFFLRLLHKTLSFKSEAKARRNIWDTRFLWSINLKPINEEFTSSWFFFTLKQEKIAAKFFRSFLDDQKIIVGLIH